MAKTKTSAQVGKKTKKVGDKKQKVSSKKDGSESIQENHNRDLGKRGEDAAARYLEHRGYDILARNWECPYGEADIVARSEEDVVFVEVKTRTDEERGLPEEAVTPEKRKRYEQIAASFLKTYEKVNVPVRFDVVGILVIAPDRALVRHHINAFGKGF